MRTLTTAQQMEITSPAEIALIVNAATTSVQYISTPVKTDSGTYMDYIPGLEIETITQECDWLGGMSAISDVNIILSNPNLESDILASEYLENEEITISIMLNNSTVHTIFKGVITDWVINQENWEISVFDESEKYNVDLLVEITKDNYPYADESALGLHLPIVYGISEPGFNIYLPLVNINSTKPKLILANHATTAGTTDSPIYVYFPEIDFYGKLNNFTGYSDSRTKPTYFEYEDADCILSNYEGYTIGSQSNVADDVEKLKDKTDELDIANSETLSIVLDAGNLGYIYQNTDVVMSIDDCSGLAGDPAFRLYNVADGAAVTGSDANVSLVAGYDTYNPDGPEADGTSIWTFYDFSNIEWQIVCDANDTITIGEIYFSINFRYFGRKPSLLLSRRGIRSIGQKINGTYGLPRGG